MSDKQPCNVKIRVADGSQRSELPPSRDLTAEMGRGYGSHTELLDCGAGQER